MICPYNLIRKTHFSKWEQKPLETNDSVMTAGTTIEQTTFELSECMQDQCGAYFDGKCNYKGAVQ